MKEKEWIVIVILILVIIIAKIINCILVRFFKIKKKKDGWLLDIIKFVAGRVMHIVRVIAQKIEERKGSYKHIGGIKGYVDESERVKGEAIVRRRGLAGDFGKWKEMSNAMKIRSLYVKRINGHIKKGYVLKLSNTATETGKELVKDNREENDILYTTYNKARYSKVDVVTDEEVENITKLVDVK